MLLASVADVRERLALAELKDSEIESALKRASRDYKNIVFDGDEDNYDQIEAVSCKAIYYLAPLLWQRIQQRANEYDETLETFKDLEVFQQYWLDRAESIPSRREDGDITKVGIKWAAV